MSKLYDKLAKQAYEKGLMRVDSLPHPIEGKSRRKLIDHAINREMHVLICAEIEKIQVMNPASLLQNIDHHLGLLRDSEKRGRLVNQALTYTLLIAKCIIKNSTFERN